MALTGLNTIWSVDFMHDTTYDGRTFRTFNVIDEGNREGLRIECGRSISSARVLRMMEQLVEVYGRPDAIRLDNGPEFTAQKFVEWAETNGGSCSTSSPASPA
jgi:putative transposase